MKNKFIIAFLMGMLIFSACKKDVSVTNPITDPLVPVTTVTDKIKDTALLVAKDLYLWYDKIPATFDAQAYADPDKIMTAIRQYSIEPGFSQPVDRWSFAYKQAEWDNVSSGISQDFGLNVFFMAEGDLRVRSVERASPAGKAGVERGWRITKINGSTNITTANADFIVNNVYSSSATSFSFVKPDGSTADLNLTAGTYQEHPVYLDTVYTSGSKKIGYLVFNSFLGDTTEIYNEFQRVFDKFSSQQVNELVVDLRYNGGGYVSVQEKLADYVVNNSANGGLMMKEQFNDKYTEYNESTVFHKKGSLSLPRVFFIVSKNTASASELLINNLKPYMDVKLVGPSNTYGKPVGFFPFPVGDWYVFPVSFRSTNKNGEGNYFNGITLDAQAADGLDKKWGDKSEAPLAAIFQFLSTGSYGLSYTPSANMAKTAQVISGNETLDQNSFKGAIDTRKLN